MSERAFPCGLYLPGHDVHWIQAKVSAKPDAIPPAPGHLLEVKPDGLLIVESYGRLHRLWNHDPDRLERLVNANDGVVSYQPGFSLLRTSSESGNFLFCVGDAEHPAKRPCPTEPPTGSLTELLEEAGGFSLPGNEVLRRLREEASE
jgi:hypothetical protein